MGSKKRPASSIENPIESSKDKMETPDESSPSSSSGFSEKLKLMERHKVRKALDKERRRLASGTKPKAEPASETKHKADLESENKQKRKSESDSKQKSDLESENTKKESKEHNLKNKVSASSSQPGLHLDLFRGLSSPESSAREGSASQLVAELRDVHRAYEEEENGDNGDEAKLEAKKDDGLENCAPSLRYAIRRLVRGVSSSREFARQGFALALASVLNEIKAVKLDSLMKLIEDDLDVSAGMRGQEAKDNLLGRLFAYGSIARSGRISEEWKLNKNSNIIKEFVGTVTSLAGKKRYLSEPAVSIILDLSDKLPDEAILTQVLEASGLKDWFERAAQTGDPDALFLALKLQERVTAESDLFGNLLPCPFSTDKFFARDNLLYISPCFKESTFCLPRIHSIWPVVVHMLVPDSPSLEDSTRASKKHKKSKKSNSPEETTTNLRNFCEIVMESSLLFSSHDRKHLALNVLLMLLPKIPPSSFQIILSSKIVYCLMDILSNKSSWLHNAGLHFLNGFVDFVNSSNFDRRIAAIIALQKHSKGKFDNITKTQAVKQLITKFVDMESCLYFVQSLVSLFVDEGPTSDEPSDQSQTTDENSDLGSLEEKDPSSNSNNGNGNPDSLKNWIVDTMPRVLKNLKLNPNLKSLTDEEIVKFAEEKFRVQAEIMKFLAVQGLFTASLGTEVTSFELQEKFKWPKNAISNSLRAVCIENLQSLLEEAQKGEGSRVLNEVEPYDLGSYLTRFVGTVCNIPSVSLYTALSDEDDKAFKKLLAMESKLCNEERKVSPGIESSRMHAMRYLLIQLMLQILLRPGELSEAAIDLIICCKKAFSFISQTESEEEDESDESEAPKFIDVLVDTFLSLLPHSSGPLNYAIEQVFRSLCEEVTEAGLIRMLRIIKKELNPRHVAVTEGESENEEEEDGDDDFIAIEDDVMESGAGLSDESEGGRVGDLDQEDAHDNDDDDDDKTDDMDLDEVNNVDKIGGSDDSDGMDDDAMFRMDAYLATMFKERKISGSESAQSQLMPFKFRVLALLEIYLHKNPGKTQVLTIYSFLVQAYVKSHANTGGEQFRQRVGGILQKKIFKAKDYPKAHDIQLSTLRTLIEKSLKLASRSKFKSISSLSQNATFWLLKIITSMNFPKSELESVVEVFQNILVDYFSNKKSRLKLGFIKEVMRRYAWVGPPLFGFLIEKCSTTKAEFRRIETLDLVECVMKTLVLANKGGEQGKDASSSTKLVKKNLCAICELIGELLVKLPEKQSRRAEVRRFCNRVLNLVSGLNLNKNFVKGLKPEVYALCEKKLGAAFNPFKTEN